MTLTIFQKKGQVTVEFLLLVGMAFFVVISLLAAIFSVSAGNTKTKAYDELDDLGKSLQQEFLLAAQMEDGYIRKINIPTTMNGLQYDIVVNQTSSENSYVRIVYENQELYYLIPPVSGNITKGFNLISKHNSTLRIN